MELLEKLEYFKTMHKIFAFICILLILSYGVWSLFNNSVFDDFGEPIMSFGWQCLFFLGEITILVSGVGSIICAIVARIIKKKI